MFFTFFLVFFFALLTSYDSSLVTLLRLFFRFYFFLFSLVSFSDDSDLYLYFFFFLDYCYFLLRFYISFDLS
jgi:hypothetical protein